MHAHTILTNLLYPPACLLCRTPIAPSGPDQGGQPFPAVPSGMKPADRGRPPTVCEPCVRDMPRSGPPVCVTCGMGLPGAYDAILQCRSCRNAPPAFAVARAPWRYTGLAQGAVRQFKYHRRWRIGRWLAEDMAMTARSSLPLDEVAAVLPVPLHWLKRRLHGFNAAESLASAVARALERPYAPRALTRTRWTATQTRLSWRERARNVREAFTARERWVRDRTVLLVDDVLTSGATANACAAALKAAGAQDVLVLTAARTPLG